MTAVDAPRRGTKPSRPMVASMLFLLAVGLFRLGSASFWNDEALSVMTTRIPASNVADAWWNVVMNMSLYYALLRPWVWLLGEGEYAVRMLSLALALPAIPLMHAVARRLFDERVAAIAAAATVLNGFFVGYARTARGYSLTITVTLLAMYLLLRALDRGTSRAWTAYGAVAGIGMYVQFSTSFAVLAHLVVIARARRLREAVPAAIAAVVVSAPAVANLLAGASPVDWLRSASPGHLLDIMVSLAGGIVPLFAYLVAIQMAVRARGRAPREGMRFAATTAIVPFVAAAALSLVRPVLIPRYLAVALPSLILVIAAGLAHAPARRSRAAIVAVALALSAFGLAPAARGVTLESQDWRAVTTGIAARARAGDAVVVTPAYALDPFLYYAGRTGLQVPVLGAPEAAPGPPTALARFVPAAQAEALPRTTGMGSELAGRFSRIWMVTGPLLNETYVDQYHAIDAELLGSFRRAYYEIYDGTTILQIALFER